MRFLYALISIGIAQAAGLVGSIFTAQSVATWYATLERPLLAPPNWVFGPVWITLYALMGLAAWLVWEKRHTHPLARTALIVYGAQLLLNAGWSFLFFGLQMPSIAFVELVVLAVFIVATIVVFWRVHKVAGLLLLPYLLWVLFAGYLNYGIWMLN